MNQHRNTPAIQRESKAAVVRCQLPDDSGHLDARVRAVEIDGLWVPTEVPRTYWILMLSGVNQADEVRIAKVLLTWQAFFAKDSARVLCVQSSERDSFRSCSSRFEVHDCPTLVMSDSPHMKSYLKIEPNLLRALRVQSGGVQRFLARIHALAENGRSLEDLQQLMTADAFWQGLKVVYKEIKGLISIKLSPG